MWISIKELTELPEYLVQEMLRNVLAWDQSSDNAIEILTKNDELMRKYQTFSKRSVTETEVHRLQQLINKMKLMNDFLKQEKQDVIENINQVNKSQKGISHYLNDFSESFYVDKDF